MTGAALSDPLYYLRNFQQAIAWVVERSQGLLSPAEQKFSDQLANLPVCAQALLARLLMRQGVLFRASKIRYPEIESIETAYRSLTEIGWVDPAPALSLNDVFRLTTHAERLQRFGDAIRRMTKQEALERLLEQYAQRCTFQQWLNTEEPVYKVTIAPVAVQFRLLHFGNFYQQWHEYTLAHLQIFKYESVALDQDSRPFESRADVEFFYALYDCHQAFQDGAELQNVLALLPNAAGAPGWLKRRWDRLRYHLGREAERQDQAETALQLYDDNAQPEACVRRVRLLECLERDDDALDAARGLINSCASEFVAERVRRIVARIERRRGVRVSKPRESATWLSTHLQLHSAPDERVELYVQTYLSSDEAPAHYVENSLIGSLFGLLCWDALFQPLRGAFFHRFQSAPADMGCPDFVVRRRATFEACLRLLDTGAHVDKILRTFAEKYGTSAPFVHWLALDEPLLRLALECIPAEHLKLYFARLLDDLSENATGFPDLVQFFPAQRTYKWVEVKGPGDRLQDHQRRWFAYCARHQLPVEVCRVSWA